MKDAKKLCEVLFITIITLPFFAFASDNIQLESAIIFNTSCTPCHEGECSGRLSFHLAKGAANQHIRRYGGELSLEKIRQLSELLRYMKEECSYYPFSLALAEDRIWTSGTLAKLQPPSRQAYFIPLGNLEPGSYRLLFNGLNEKTKICAEIISKDFDFISEESLNRGSEPKWLLFYIDEYSEYFLRITAQEPINLRQIELVSNDKNSADNK